MDGRFWTGEGKLLGIEPEEVGRWLLKDDIMFLGIEA